MGLAADTVRNLITQSRLGEGEAKTQALAELMPALYDHLRALAARFLQNERPGHTLRATALVNEAYLRLAGAELAFEDRSHFLALAAGAMRRILVDHARGKRSLKRGEGAAHVPIDEVLELGTVPDQVLSDVDDALHRLAQFDERKARIIEMIYFGGLTYEETASALSISDVTVHRDLKLAKAWLHRELKATA